ncbi:Serine/threonine protein kinase OS=Streptomyces microflavus OX=1919 GN=Smic_50180 PE=4 SV=1 [Streptomyces microflavus]
MAEGQFTWQDSSGREVYVRNLAMIVDGRSTSSRSSARRTSGTRSPRIPGQAIASYRVNA